MTRYGLSALGAALFWPAAALAADLAFEVDQKPGEGYVLEVTVKNKGSRTLHILPWDVAFETGLGVAVNGEAVSVLCKGRPLVAKPVATKASAPRREDFIKLAPGATLTHSLTLAHRFDIPADTSCEASLALDVLARSEKGITTLPVEGYNITLEKKP